MVNVPFRAAPGLVWTEKFTLPFPLPLAAPTMEIHGTFADAVQLQPRELATVTVPDPPAPPNDRVTAES
jgi:hypothetical protein